MDLPLSSERLRPTLATVDLITDVCMVDMSGAIPLASLQPIRQLNLDRIRTRSPANQINTMAAQAGRSRHRDHGRDAGIDFYAAAAAGSSPR